MLFLISTGALTSRSNSWGFISVRQTSDVLFAKTTESDDPSTLPTQVDSAGVRAYICLGPKYRTVWAALNQIVSAPSVSYPHGSQHRTCSQIMIGNCIHHTPYTYLTSSVNRSHDHDQRPDPTHFSLFVTRYSVGLPCGD